MANVNAGARGWNQLVRALSSASRAAETLPVRASVSAKGRLVEPLRRSVELFDSHHAKLSAIDDVDTTLIAALGRARNWTQELLEEARDVGPRPGRPEHALASIERDGGKLALPHRERIVGDLREVLLDVGAMRSRALEPDPILRAGTSDGFGHSPANPASGWIPIR